MANEDQPFAGLGDNVQVAGEAPPDAAGAPQTGQVQGAGSASALPATPPSGTDPWAGLGDNVQVAGAPPPSGSGGEGRTLAENMRAPSSRERDKALASQISEVITDPRNPTFNWFNQVTRAATFNLTDYWLANQVFKNLKGDFPELTQGVVLDAIRQTMDKEQRVSATVVGAVGPILIGGGVGALARGGVALGRGAVALGREALGRGAAEAAGVNLSKEAVVEGTLGFFGTHPKTAWLATATLGGALGGSVEEGARQGISEYLDTVQGDTFDMDTLLDRTIGGAVIGSIGGVVGSGAIAGARGLLSTAARWFGGDASTSIKAVKEIYKRIGLPGEQMGSVAKRVDGYVQDFRLRNSGKSPALAEIIPPQQAADVVDVIRSVKGLDIHAGKLADDMVERARETLSGAAKGDTRILSDMQVRAVADDAFDAVIRKEGDTMVDVPPDVLESMGANPAWLNSQSGAAADGMRRVIDVTRNIGDLRVKARRLGNKDVHAQGRLEVAGLRDELAQLIDKEIASSELGLSDVNQLKNLIRLRNAVTLHIDAQRSASEATFDLSKMQGILGAAENILADFTKKGLKIRLIDADHLRRNASRAAFTASKTDPILAETLRTINGGLSRVGVKEVPAYGEVIDQFSQALTRVEARDIGREAVLKNVDPRDVAVHLGRGRDPGTAFRPAAPRDPALGSPAGRDISGRRVGENRFASLVKGADEGVALAVGSATRRSPAELRRMAKALGEPDTASAVMAAAPGRGGRIVTKAGQVEKSLAGAEEVRRPMSIATLAQEEQKIKELAQAGFLSGSGGAARAGFVTRTLVSLGIGRTAAKKMVDMAADPNKIDELISLLNRRGVSSARFAVILGAAADATTTDFGIENRQR